VLLRDCGREDAASTSTSAFTSADGTRASKRDIVGGCIVDFDAVGDTTVGERVIVGECDVSGFPDVGYGDGASVPIFEPYTPSIK
jgi:hypothetical protein